MENTEDSLHLELKKHPGITEQDIELEDVGKIVLK